MQALIAEPIALHLAPLYFAFSISIFVGIGWIIGKYRLRKQDGVVLIRDSLATAIFALSALVLGFTFASATSNYSVRIDANRAQASAIKEAYMSLKYLAISDQLDIKKTLKELLDFRVDVIHRTITYEQLNINSEQLLTLIRKINEDTVLASQRAVPENRPLVEQILNPAITNLATVFNKGLLLMKSHPPARLMQFLFSLLSIGGLLIGYTMAIKKEHDWFSAILYVVLIGVCLHVILSFEYPNILMSHREVDDDLLRLKTFVDSSNR